MTREEAIEILKMLICQDTRVEADDYEQALNMAIKALSQEPTSEMVHVETLHQVMWERDIAIGQLKELGYSFGQKIEPCDAISRETVLSKIKEVCFSKEWTQFRLDNGSNGQRDFLINYIRELPSVNPQPCDDAISREDAHNMKYDKVVDINGVEYVMLSEVQMKIRKMPSVTQKSGKWILLDECANSGYYCSECHKKLVKEGWSNTVKKINFCPNCGAKMVEP